MNAMVERTHVELEARGDYRRTPPHLAANNGHLPVAQFLCEQGGDTEVWTTNGGMKPLHLAANNGHLPVVQYLCEQGADKEARSMKGNTSLHVAAHNGYIDVVQYLRET